MKLYSDDRYPTFDDPIEPELPDDWLPSNEPAKYLVRSYLVIPAIKAILRGLHNATSRQDQLQNKSNLCTKICIFNEEIKKLLNSLPQDDSNTRTFKRYHKKQILKHIKPITRVRNKLGAHLDQNLSSEELRQLWSLCETCDYKTSLLQMFQLLRDSLQSSVYGWSRRNSNEKQWKLMGIPGVEVQFNMEDGKPNSISNVTLCQPPTKIISDCIDEAESLTKKVL
jgi:hypothetical protein